MTAATPIARIRRAREIVRQALEGWNGADLEGANHCRELLAEAAADIREAAGAAAADRLHLPLEARRALADLKHDTVRMTRLVDACAAFQRNLALRLGHADPNYNASGQASPEAVSPARRVVVDA